MVVSLDESPEFESIVIKEDGSGKKSKIVFKHAELSQTVVVSIPCQMTFVLQGFSLTPRTVHFDLIFTNFVYILLSAFKNLFAAVL